MKVTNLDERIHVLEGEATAASVMKTICESGVQEDPFYVCDVDDIAFKLKQWKLLLPRVEPHYAVKCNDSKIVLEILAALGTGFDCASKGEINKVLDLGVEQNRIIFAHPAKPASHIRHAAALGINLATFDNEIELHKMKAIHPNCKLVLRIRCDAASAAAPLGMKFGCEPLVDAPRLLELARDLGLDVVGISFHVGSGCRDPPAFRKAISFSRHLFDLGARLGFKMTLLDIGGGYPGDSNSAFAKIADVINSSLDEYFPSPDVRVIAEPGRYFVCSAFTLATNIHSKREIRSPDGEITHVMYYINDGVYGSFNAKMYEEITYCGFALHPPNTKLVTSSVWGPTCDGMDKIEDTAMLPLLDLGSWLIYKNMGAYSLPIASPFNGFPVPKVHVVSTKSAWILLKDRLPFNEDDFVVGNTPANLRLGLDIGGTAPLVEVARRLSLAGAGAGAVPQISHEEFPPIMCRRASVVEQSEISGTSPLFIEFVQVGPIN